MDISFMLLPFLLLALGVNLAQGSSCFGKCKFDKSCKTTNYIQHSACAYSCVCNGQSTYYVEDSFTQCGRGKRCYQGDCLTEVPRRCQAIYGINYLGLLNPSNPCVYYCLNLYAPCILYEENFANGGRCYTYSNYAGRCFNGRCTAGFIRL
ncbi:unnamed protein product [Larinioides sclopetarius]|uniref:Uncharacterized protein n=1 Tax=Larinioides sclopetarius TaxID=280406 RepID=A0AAV2AI43_9ARAC